MITAVDKGIHPTVYLPSLLFAFLLTVFKLQNKCIRPDNPFNPMPTIKRTRDRHPSKILIPLLSRLPNVFDGPQLDFLFNTIIIEFKKSLRYESIRLLGCVFIPLQSWHDQSRSLPHDQFTLPNIPPRKHTQPL